MTRGFYLLFGVAAYAVAMVTILYLMAFVGDLPWVPRTVDFGPAAAPIPALLIDAALVAIFGLQHSIMARQGFKAAWTRIVPDPIERSAYVLFASAALILLFVLWRPLSSDVWRIENGAAAALIWAVFAAGWAIVFLSTFLISHFELFGLSQAYRHLRAREAAEPQFRQPLFYKIVRHPLYSGFFLALWAAPVMSQGHLLLAVGLSVYVLIAIRYEERDMIRVFGADYEMYREHVGMLAPRLRRRAG